MTRPVAAQAARLERVRIGAELADRLSHCQDCSIDLFQPLDQHTVTGGDLQVLRHAVADQALGRPAPLGSRLA